MEFRRGVPYTKFGHNTVVFPFLSVRLSVLLVSSRPRCNILSLIPSRPLAKGKAYSDKGVPDPN